ncbi:MAG: hypothetical protein OXP71_18405 [Candidatus Poribacteria bacterium]|nr:hypothetical protein [Candidatus Poribacteria bacterium]
MTIRCLSRIVPKIVTCTMGGFLAGLVFLFTFEVVLDGDLYGDDEEVIGWSFVIGLIFGISWAIEHEKVRYAFVIPP